MRDKSIRMHQKAHTEKTKIHISTQVKISTTRQCLPIHAESVNMMGGLDEAKEDRYFTDNP